MSNISRHDLPKKRLRSFSVVDHPLEMKLKSMTDRPLMVRRIIGIYMIYHQINCNENVSTIILMMALMMAMAMMMVMIMAIR